MTTTEYTNSGSDHLRGQTWSYVKRSKFAGTEIPLDKESKNEIIKQKGLEYKEKNPEATAAECIEWGKRFISREKKHYRAYLKGKNAYSYKGGRYLVEDESRLEHFIKMAQDFEQRNIEKAQRELELTEDKAEVINE
jgi:hypothetical protein